MKKILLIAAAITMVACEDLTKYDINPKAATQVQAQTLFANAEKSFADWLVTPSVNSNIFKLIAQHWTETTYIDESNYDLSTRQIPQNQWHTLYRDVLLDLKEAKKVVGTGLDAADVAEVQANQKAIIEVMEVLTWSVLVQTFGDVPYTDALDFNKPQPKYDDGLVIMKDLVVRLDAALAAMDDSFGAFGDGSDIIYNSDVASWIKFANSLKLRIGISIADADGAAAEAIVEEAVADGVFESNDDNALFAYLDGPPNTNPIWTNLVQSGRNDFVAANTLVDFMNNLDDPRREVYFTTDIDGNFTGGIYGSNNNFATYSHVGDVLTAPAFEGIIMDYSEVEFYLAEAVERGMSVGGTAESHYNAAITASMDYWGVSTADRNSYLALPEVAYTTAAGTYKQKIGEQSWVALYNRGFEAWTQWRRLDFPTLVAPPDALSEIPVRYTYPTSEQNLNKANWTDAAAKLGSDDVETKLFFDKF